jgi:PhnB protein
LTNYAPEGWRSVTPRIFTGDVAGQVRFVRKVFGATGRQLKHAPTPMKIGDSTVMIADGGGVRAATPAFLYVYVKNADVCYRRALAEGATSIEEPTEMPYGDRRATVRDPWKNIWQIAVYRSR